MPDAQPAASSPAPVAPLDTLSTAERASWRVTGDLPTPTAPDAVAASSSAPAGDQPASTDATSSAASEPAKGKGVKARSAELDAEISDMREKLKLRATLRDELARLQPAPDAPPAASSPAPTASRPEALPTPDLSRPMLTEPEFFAAFPDVPYGQYGVYTTKYLLAEDRQQAQRETQQRQLQQTWATQVDAVRAEHPDYDVQMAALESLPDSPANRAIAAALSEAGNARLFYHLATHLDEAKRIVGLSPSAALVALGALDAQIGQSSASSPVLKTITNAPAPPPSVTTRAAVPANELESALAAGDVRRYRELANARDVATYR